VAGGGGGVYIWDEEGWEDEGETNGEEGGARGGVMEGVGIPNGMLFPVFSFSYVLRLGFRDEDKS
jgi:hypothetical protein